MITLTAKIEINQVNPSPFVIGKSVIGGGDLIGSTINVTKEFDRRNLLSIERSIFDRSDLKMPSFGIISNVGNFEFNDNNGQFLGYANAGVLVEGMKVEMYLNNTLVESATEKIGAYYTDKWDYDNDNRVVSVSLKDDLEEWQDINVEGILYSPIKSTAKNGEWFYKKLYEITPAKFNMFKFEELSNYTKEILTYTYISNPLLRVGTLWRAWEEICMAFQLHIYKNSDGRTVCRYNGGN